MKNKRFGKKQLVLALMVTLLGAAVYLNYYVAGNTSLSTNGGQTAEPPVTTETTAALGESRFVSNTTAAPDYFATVRKDREQAREEALATLKDALQDAKADENLKRELVAVAQTVAKHAQQETATESLVKAKGYPDCAVFINEDHCHVAVRAETLSESQTLQIAQIVMAQTDVPAGNINILAVE